MVRAAVLGAGCWGTTFAKVLVDAGGDVTLWGRRPDLVRSIAERHENADYLPGVRLPPALRATAEPGEALAGAEIVVLALPAQTLRANLTCWAPAVERGATLVSLMKGIELGTAKRMSEVIDEVVGCGADRVGVEVPITAGVVGVCHLGVRATDLVPALMGRDMKAEHAP